MPKSYLVTGGSGFLGSALVRHLVHEGNRVVVFDNNSRGDLRRLRDVLDHIEFIEGDIRDLEAVRRALEGIDCVCHLAFVNGTEFFYSKPELVLEVGVKGMLNVLDGCLEHNVPELVLASSSEVYQTPATIPTGEDVPLSIPDPGNPRYSYGAGKIISEILAINYGRKYFQRVVIFRPHNVYGPDMGWEHVIPQFVLRAKSLLEKDGSLRLRFPVQGDGSDTRAFVFIDDFTAGLGLVVKSGRHLETYNIGTEEEVTIGVLAGMIGSYMGREFEIVPGPAATGGTHRRCPDIRRIRELGYAPKTSLNRGLELTVPWYEEHAAESQQARNTGRISGAVYS